MSNNEEAIYSQKDMDNVLEAVAKFKREAELSNQLLWAVVHITGGHVKVPYQIWANGDGEISHKLAMWDNPETHEMNLKVVEND